MIATSFQLPFVMSSVIDFSFFSKDTPHPPLLVDTFEMKYYNRSFHFFYFSPQVQQSLGGEKTFKGPLHCANKLYREGGIRSLYKGTCATLLRGEVTESQTAYMQLQFNLFSFSLEPRTDFQSRLPFYLCTCFLQFSLSFFLLRTLNPLFKIQV